VSPKLTFAQMTTPGGHLCGEVTSALQKSIRRGHERDALYWVSELDAAGFGNYAWKRLRLIASEDVGIADSNVAVQVRALYENWKETVRDPKVRWPRLFLVHATLILVRAPKSRIVDHAAMLAYDGGQEWRDVPDYALDRHTRRGRRLGRGIEHFFDVGARLVGEALDDPYRDEARALKTGAELPDDEQLELDEPPS